MKIPDRGSIYIFAPYAEVIGLVENALQNSIVAKKKAYTVLRLVVSPELEESTFSTNNSLTDTVWR